MNQLIGFTNWTDLFTTPWRNCRVAPILVSTAHWRARFQWLMNSISVWYSHKAHVAQDDLEYSEQVIWTMLIIIFFNELSLYGKDMHADSSKFHVLLNTFHFWVISFHYFQVSPCYWVHADLKGKIQNSVFCCCLPEMCKPVRFLMDSSSVQRFWRILCFKISCRCLLDVYPLSLYTCQPARN